MIVKLYLAVNRLGGFFLAECGGETFPDRFLKLGSPAGYIFRRHAFPVLFSCLFFLMIIEKRYAAGIFVFFRSWKNAGYIFRRSCFGFQACRRHCLFMYTKKDGYYIRINIKIYLNYVLLFVKLSLIIVLTISHRLMHGGKKDESYQNRKHSNHTGKQRIL